MSTQLSQYKESIENKLIVRNSSFHGETGSSDVENVNKQDKLSKKWFEYHKKDISDQEIKLKTLFGAPCMVSDLPPLSMISIKERSVNRIRKKIQTYRGDSTIYYDIDISSLARLDTPEGFTRVGVMLIQLSTFMKSRAMIGVESNNSVDRESEPVLYRNIIKILKEAVKIGFPYIRVPGGVHIEDLQGIWSLADKKGIEIILTNSVGGGEKWSPPEQDKISYCSYYELLVTVDNKEDLDRLLKLTDIVNLFMKDNRLIIRVRGIFSPVLNLLTPALGSSMIQYDIDQDRSDKGGDILSHKDLLMKEMGLSKEYMKSKWSLRKYKISDKTKINYIFGRLSGTSRTVVMFNGEARRSMKESIFIPYESDYNDFSICIELLKNSNSNGAVIDIPYKSLATNFVDDRSEISDLVGSINLIRKDDNGRLIGYNTEGQAVVELLEKTNVGHSSLVLIMGSGTTGRSAAASLHAAGYKVLLLNLGNNRLENFTRKLGPGAGTISLENLKKLKGKIDIMVNATPDGVIKDTGNAGKTLMVSEIARVIEPRVGIELSYRENWTPFLSSVESRGGLTISGVEFLMKKKEMTYRILMGDRPDVGFMKELTREAGLL